MPLQQALKQKIDMKKQYALLRNNIQIGVFTLKEISKIELLPTDLIWVQAKSIAWLSPDKIDELKQYVKSAAQVLPFETAQVKYPGVTISATEATPKVEVIEDKVVDNNDTSPVAKQGVQPNPIVDETEVTSKTEIEESVDEENDTVSSGVATQGKQPKLVVNETEVTSKSEIEESVQHDSNTNISSEITGVRKAKPLVNETEVIEATISQDVEMGNSFVATQDRQSNAISQIEAEVEEVFDKPDTDSSNSCAKAYVLLPGLYNNKKEVALRTNVNEASDSVKSSVTPYVMKPETPRITEGHVYVKFPIGVPQSLFYRNEKSIDDKLELKASEVSNTKIYAAKPKPRK